MLNRIKKKVYADDFTYFIRYFGLFTLIFSAMTLIIIQVMRSSLYTTVDNNLITLSQTPNSVTYLAYFVNGLQEEPKSLVERREPFQQDTIRKANVSLSTIAFLLDDEYKYVTSGNGFLDMESFKFDDSYLNRIRQIGIANRYGHVDSYRVYVFDMDPNNEKDRIKYGVVLSNITQLEQTSDRHEKMIAWVMIGFWLVSIIASIYLAKVSVKPLLESMQKQQDFVENASHELRTPLAVLQNRLESLFRKPEATILESSENIASSLDEVRNMRMLTTNLLNIARRDDGLKPEYCEIGPDFFDTAFANYEIIAEENDKSFRYDNMVHKTLVSDSTLLKQLMTILFDNAIKYTEEDGEIRFLAVTNDRYLVLQVSDNGPGIKNEDKKKIFDRFYRVDKARTRQKGGFGLGLSLAKQIVDAFKGTITVKDNKPRGSVFEIKLPLKADSRKRPAKGLGNK